MTARSTAAPYLLSLLLLCAAVEFAFMRVLLRSGPALSSDGGEHIADAILVIGHTAMNLGVVLGMLLLGVIGWHLFAAGNGALRASGLATGALLLALAIVLFSGTRTPALLALSAGISIAIVLLALSGVCARSRELAVLALFGAAYVATFTHFALQALAGRQNLPLPSLPAYYLGETLVVLAVFGALLLARGPWSWKVVAAGAGVCALFLLARMGAPWLVSTIGIWNFGVSMSLPALVYGAALGCFVVAVARLWRRERLAAVALLLMGLGGMKLDLVYFHLLAVVGFLLLVVWTHERRHGAWTAATHQTLNWFAPQRPGATGASPPS